MRRIILVGHSMGGLISDLMIRKGGTNLWRQFATQPMEQLVVKPATKKHMEDLIDFEPRKDVARVVFVATPHRGSPLALRQLASFLASFIKLPYIPLNSDMTTIRQALRSDMRRLFSAPVNGILCLKAQSPILLSILKLPRSEKVPYHSIIGDQGKHNSPNSSDGIVPYWSSHVEGAVSEKVVSSGHGANENSEGIKEIDRILVSALKE
jgi:pimeloyl-ACP methyl ester carboxylesterase